MNKFKLGTQGIGIVGALAVLAGVTATAVVVFKKSSHLASNSASAVKNIRLNPIKQKVTRLGGYLVANNFVLCSQTAWGNGNGKNTCMWNDKSYATDVVGFDADNFGLSEDGLDSDKALTFNINPKKFFQDKGAKSILTGKNSFMKFKLVHKNDLDSAILNSKTRNNPLDGDDHYILLTGSLEYKSESGKIKVDGFKAYYKRPIAIPKMNVASSECTNRCDVSLSESPFPECRSTQYADRDTKTDVQAVTQNLGPGVIYNLKYNRQINLSANSSTGAEVVGSEVDVSTGNLIKAGENFTWSDSFPCVTEDYDTAVSKTVGASFSEVVDEVYANIVQPFSLLLPQRAYALRCPSGYSLVGGTCQKTVTSTSVSYDDTAPVTNQHSNPVGTLEYDISKDLAGSLIEPFRMAAALNVAKASSFKGNGQERIVTTTTVKKTIYVAPTH